MTAAYWGSFSGSIRPRADITRDQGLLHQVVHGVGILHARAHDPTQHRHQLDERIVIVRTRGSPAARGASVTTTAPPSPAGWA